MSSLVVLCVLTAPMKPLFASLPALDRRLSKKAMLISLQFFTLCICTAILNISNTKDSYSCAAGLFSFIMFYPLYPCCSIFKSITKHHQQSDHDAEQTAEQTSSQVLSSRFHTEVMSDPHSEDLFCALLCVIMLLFCGEKSGDVTQPGLCLLSASGDITL